MQEDALSQYLDSLAREGSYRVVETLRASPLETTELVMLPLEGGGEEGPFVRKRIRRESGLGTAYARIYHAQQSGMKLDYVPRIRECYHRDDEVVTVTEYMPGQTLLDLVYEQDPSIMLAAWVFPLLCDAVSELHEKFDPPIIHRDLKPSNIIVAQDRLAIIDFGIARDFDEKASTDTTQFGTRAYAPPEQFGYGQTDVRSDVYALGMLLYFLLTEATPTPKTMQKRFKDADIPEAMRMVIEKATSFDPANRYASARELKTAFAQALLKAGPGKQTSSATQGSGAPGISDPIAAATAIAEHAIPPQNAPSYVQEPAFVPSQPGQPMPLEPPSYASANPTGPKRSSGKPRFETLGKIWNALVLTGLALMLAACFGIAFVGVEATAHFPVWYRFIGYAIILPIMFVALAYQFLDKRRLRARIPFLAKAKKWQEILGFVIIYIVSIAIAGVMTSIAGL